MSSFKKFSENKFPNKKYFFDLLKHHHISDKDYLTCNKIWNKFSMKNMGEYHDHYLKKDVLLLTDVFKKIYRYVFRILQTRSLSLFQN